MGQKGRYSENDYGVAIHNVKKGSIFINVTIYNGEIWSLFIKGKTVAIHNRIKLVSIHNRKTGSLQPYDSIMNRDPVIVL